MYIYRYIKKGMSLLLTLALLITLYSPADAQISIPETIKVGLYYTDPSVHVSTAVASFTTNAKAGISLGFFKDNAFTAVCETSDEARLTVRKDTYYTVNSGNYSEFNPGTSPLPEGEKIGPYHIRIAAGFPDIETMKQQLQVIAEKGLLAYPVYSDELQIWTGFYADPAVAQQELAIITEKLGEGDYQVVEPANNRIAVFNTEGKPLYLFGSDAALFRVKPASANDPQVLSINGMQYRGALEVRRLSGSDMTVINVVGLQEYLYGNVPPEIGGNSHPEALKAQAMASKMYAINNIGKHKKTGFDVCATTNCQVYKGFNAEIKSCNEAIDATAGKVITYDNELAKHIYYFASSAGRTEDSENVWGYPYPYLRSVEDKYEPVFSWTKTLRAADVKARIPEIGNVLGMSILKTSAAGRVTQLAVRGDKRSDPAIYTLEKCRTVFGLDSQLYTITTDADIYAAAEENAPIKTQLGGKKVLTAQGAKTVTSSNNKVHVLGADGKTKTVAVVPETYIFTGKGWGHAVGMSQEGARSMGKAGFTYDQIISHYFLGTTIQ